MIFKKVKESLDFNQQAVLNGKIYKAVSDILFDEKFLDVTESDVRTAFNNFNRKFFNESLNEDIDSATEELKPGKEFTSKSGHKIWIDEVDASFSPYDGSPIITMNYHYKLVDGKEGKSKCNTVDLFRMLKESLNEAKQKFSKRKQKEIFDFIDDLGGYGDYDDKVESVMDEFDLSRDDAEDIVWEWSINQEDSDYYESLNEAKRNLKPLVSTFGDNPENFSLHVLDKDIVVDGLFNPYTWDDGAPMLKYFERYNHPEEKSNVSLKRGRQFIYDREHEWAYFPYHGGWLAVDGDDFDWDRPYISDDEDDLDESLRTVNNLGTLTPQQLSKKERRRDVLWNKEDKNTLTAEERKELKQLQKEISDHYSMKKNLEKEDSLNEDIDDDFEDDEESSNWLKVISKPVPDSDGFLTDYTMYRDLDDPEHYVFVFGDNEIYSPDDGDWDYEAFSNEEATEWYNNYKGFTEEDEDEE